MKEKELRSLSRADLLEMLIEQSTRMQQLQQRLDAAEAQLEKREIAIANTGSLAEAALMLNGVFDAAQKACDQYMENIRLRSPQAAEQELQEALTRLEEVRRTCQEQERQTRLRCEQMVRQAKQQSQAQWDSLRRKLDNYYEEHAGLRELLELSGELTRSE